MCTSGVIFAKIGKIQINFHINCALIMFQKKTFILKKGKGNSKKKEAKK